MRFTGYALSAAAIGHVATAAVLEKRAACTSYTIVNARGTGAPQGECSVFISMNQQIRAAFPGGETYNVVYPAASNQDVTSGVTNLVNFVEKKIKSSPNECIIIEGYSQGSTLVTQSLPKLSSAAFAAVKFVYTCGNPEHNPNLACNIDQDGGKTTYGTSGQIAEKGAIPSSWFSKTYDVCYFGDGVCDKASAPHPGFPGAITPAHNAYMGHAPFVNIGVTAAKRALSGLPPKA